ncbi:MAG: arsenate reductase (azurin) small subunit [Gammaproteobacteria bacterium]
MNKLSRRGFLTSSGGGLAAGAAAALDGGAIAQSAHAANRATPPYPRQPIGKADGLSAGKPVAFSYPDASSPCALLKLGAPVPGGVGRDGDIVAYSTLCTHMGCTVVYDVQARVFKCPCHFSTFDAELAGQMVCGQATENLPQVMLEVDADTSEIFAIGVQGLIYGRVANVS